MTRKKKRVLIVEDDPGILDDLKSKLREYQRNIEIDCAGNAGEALEKLNAAGEKFDALVLDLMMSYGKALNALKGQNDPHELETGIRILDKIRQEEEQNNTAPIWVSVVTGRSHYTVESRIQKLLGNNGRLYFKPFSMLQFEHELMLALNVESQVPPHLVVSAADDEDEEDI